MRVLLRSKYLFVNTSHRRRKKEKSLFSLHQQTPQRLQYTRITKRLCNLGRSEIRFVYSYFGSGHRVKISLYACTQRAAKIDFIDGNDGNDDFCSGFLNQGRRKKYNKSD